MIELQSDDPKLLPQAYSAVDIKALVVGIDCRPMGIACLLRSGGREHMGDSIDHAMGFTLHNKVGHAVAAGEALCTIRYSYEPRLYQAGKIVEQRYRILPERPATVRC